MIWFFVGTVVALVFVWYCIDSWISYRDFCAVFNHVQAYTPSIPIGSKLEERLNYLKAHGSSMKSLEHPFGIVRKTNR
jgi:hypothetical protein